ncbi:MAG: hypothetical protein Q4F56_01150 [Candidatus Saccharibacteria bacterium]|nr:hypothetical protein [Candidatus Saccharibacteria bacterium]
MNQDEPNAENFSNFDNNIAEPTPAPEMATTPVPAAPSASGPIELSRKTTKIVIAVSFVIFMAAVAGLIALFALNRSSSAPDAARVEQVCQSHGLNYMLLNKGDSFFMDSKVEFDYGEEKLSTTINSEAVCYAAELNSNNNLVSTEPTGGIRQLTVYFIDENYSDSMPIDTYATSSGATVLEDSNDFFKAIASSGNQYNYVVAYQNTIFSATVDSIEAGEALIAELGYPDRSHAQTDVTKSNGSSSSQNSVDAHNRDVLAKITDALIEYQTDNSGKLPEIKGANLEEDEQYFIMGTLDSEFDSFFNDYIDESWFVDINGEDTYYFLQASKTAKPELADSGTITIHYNASCEGDQLVSSDNSRSFAVTLVKVNHDGYLCVDNN